MMLRVAAREQHAQRDNNRMVRWRRAMLMRAYAVAPLFSQRADAEW